MSSWRLQGLMHLPHSTIWSCLEEYRLLYTLSQYRLSQYRLSSTVKQSNHDALCFCRPTTLWRRRPCVSRCPGWRPCRPWWSASNPRPTCTGNSPQETPSVIMRAVMNRWRSCPAGDVVIKRTMGWDGFITLPTSPGPPVCLRWLLHHRSVYF